LFGFFSVFCLFVCFFFIVCLFVCLFFYHYLSICFYPTFNRIVHFQSNSSLHLKNMYIIKIIQHDVLGDIISLGSNFFDRKYKFVQCNPRPNVCLKKYVI
jgi:hypothetical protein